MDQKLLYTLKPHRSSMIRLLVYALILGGSGFLLLLLPIEFQVLRSVLFSTLVAFLLIAISGTAVFKIVFAWNKPIAYLTVEGIHYYTDKVILWEDIRAVESYSIVGNLGLFLKLKPEAAKRYSHQIELNISVIGVSKRDIAIAYAIIQSKIDS